MLKPDVGISVVLKLIWAAAVTYNNNAKIEEVNFNFIYRSLSPKTKKPIDFTLVISVRIASKKGRVGNG